MPEDQRQREFLAWLQEMDDSRARHPGKVDDSPQDQFLNEEKDPDPRRFR